MNTTELMYVSMLQKEARSSCGSKKKKAKKDKKDKKRAYKDVVKTAKEVKDMCEYKVISQKQMQDLFDEPDQRTPRMAKATYDSDPTGNDALDSNTKEATSLLRAAGGVAKNLGIVV